MGFQLGHFNWADINQPSQTGVLIEFPKALADQQLVAWPEGNVTKVRSQSFDFDAYWW